MSEGQMNSAFAEALAKRKQAEKEAEEAKNRKGFEGYGDDDREYCALEAYKEKVFRILGNPVIVRSSNTDPKLILQSKIANEKKTGYIKINWPYVQSNGKIKPDPNWILTRFYDKVNERDWVKYTEADIDGIKVEKKEGKIANKKGYNGYWKYRYDNTKIYSLLNEGNKAEWDKYGQYFYPSKRVIMNVIDRHDDWCKNNNHSKILVSNLTISEKEDPNTKEKITRQYVDTGIPATLYDNIFDSCIECGSDWLNIDLVVTKKSQEKTYAIHDAKDERRLSEEAKALAIDGPLTEEEKNYSLFDLEKYYGDSTYNKLYRNLKYLFQIGDGELGTNFLEELEELANIEVEERKKEQEANKAVEEESKQEEKVEVKEEIKVQESVEVKTEEPKEDFDVIEYFKSVFPKWDILPEIDKNILINSFESKDSNNLPVFKKEADPVTCTNQQCMWVGSPIQTETPSTISMCPVCGVEYPPQD